MRSKLIFYLVIGLLILGGIGGTFFFYQKYQSAQERLNNPEITAQEEVTRLVAAIGKLMELPTDEQPNVATVLDKEKLKDQPFFAKAENGDKVVIYSKAMKAILYRESSNKIVDVAPIQIAQPPEASASPEPSDEATPKSTVKATPEPTEEPVQE